MNHNPTSPGTGFQLSYEFNAPRELVFNAFANAEALNEWWGPVGSRNSVIHLDFKPGGIFHFKMEAAGSTTYGRFLFRSIEPYDFLEFTNSFSDEHANIVKAPFDMEFPLEILYRLRFTEDHGKTTLHLQGEPVEASAAETETFRSIDTDMQQGFTSTFDQLSVYLAKGN